MVQLIRLCFSTCSGIKEGKAIKRCELMVSFSSPAVAPGAVGGQRPECVWGCGVCFGWRISHCMTGQLSCVFFLTWLQHLQLSSAYSLSSSTCVGLIFVQRWDGHGALYSICYCTLLWHESCGYVTPGWYFDNNHSVGNIPWLWKVLCEAFCHLKPYKCPPKPACWAISIKYEYFHRSAGK